MGPRGVVGITRGLGGDKIFCIDDPLELCIWRDIMFTQAKPLVPGASSKCITQSRELMCSATVFNRITPHPGTEGKTR